VRHLRQFGFAAWLALTLVVGQQAVLLHDLGHALEQRDGGVPTEKTCDTHFACAQLASAVGASPPVLPQADEAAQAVLSQQHQGASQRTRLAYRSQAPPAIAIPA
jgi:hypothetical protein